MKQLEAFYSLVFISLPGKYARTLENEEGERARRKSSMSNHNQAIIHNHWNMLVSTPLLDLFIGKIHRRSFHTQSNAWMRQEVINEFSHNFYHNFFLPALSHSLSLQQSLSISVNVYFLFRSYLMGQLSLINMRSVFCFTTHI